MQTPAEVTFRNCDHSDAAETTIRDHVARLDRLYGRLTACRVRVDQRNRNEARSIPPVVHIEISVPGHNDIVVAHEPQHLLRKFQTPDINNAINEAFRIAEAQPGKLKDKRSDHVAAQSHEAANSFTGQIAELTPGDDHGFLLTKEGGLLYFHRNSVLTGDF